jgi:hypothetical protein
MYTLIFFLVTKPLADGNRFEKDSNYCCICYIEWWALVNTLFDTITDFLDITHRSVFA